LKAHKEIYSLTGLRFVAAFYVFLFHIHIRWPITSNSFIKNLVDQGAIGMSLFFMLSGFVLAYRYSDLQTTWKNYLINRFARIYPIYLVAALVTIPWIGIPFQENTLKEMGQLLLILTSNIFLIQAWFPQFFSLWNDGASWSISVEAFCYLLFPLFLPLLLRLSIYWLQCALTVFYLLSVMPGMTEALFGGAFVMVFYSMPIFRLPEFLIGICIFLTIRLGINSRFGAQSQLIVLGGLVGYLGFFSEKFPVYIGHNWISIPVFAFVIFSLYSSKGVIASLLQSRLFVWLGKISYCFYSFQALLIFFLIRYHDSMIEMIPILQNNLLLASASFCTLIAFSTAGYYLIEEPMRKWIRDFSQLRKSE